MSGKHTPLILLSLSLAVWVVGLFALPAVTAVSWAGFDLGATDSLLPNIISLVCYVASAFLTGALYLLERRIHWLATLYLWIVATSLLVHGNVLFSVSAFVFMLLMTMLFSCQTAERTESSLFAAFAVMALASLLLPQFLLLLPLGVVYMFTVNIMSLKRFMAALLGFAAPFWLIYGTVYVYSGADFLLLPFNAGLKGLFTFYVAEPLPVRLLLTFIELGIMLPAAVVFAGSSVPGKPLLRRRLMFVMLASVWLMFLSWFSGENFELFYVWRIPGMAIMASYLFTVKMTKATNIYFIFINVLWLAVAAFSIWQI